MADLTRRQALGVAGASVAGAYLLAGCVQPRATPAEDASAVAALGAGTRVAALADVEVGGALAVELDGHALLLTRPGEQQVRLFSATCTHAGCRVGPGQGELECPCHDSRFALADGAVLGGPAREPLAEVPVAVQDGEVVLA